MNVLRLAWLTPFLGSVLVDTALPATAQCTVEQLTLQQVSGSPFFRNFGNDVAIDGDTILVGEYPFNLGGWGPGVVTVFERQGTAWVQSARLSEPGDDRFGTGLWISGSTAFIHGESTYVYEKQGSSWGKVLTLPNAGVALDGTRALLRESTTTPVMVYERLAGTWTLTSTFHPPGFGQLALSGDRALVGSYVYERLGGTWVQTARLIPAGMDNTFTGYADLAGDIAVIGGYTDATGLTNSVHVFEWQSGSWTETGSLTVDEAVGGGASGFGAEVRVAGDRILVAMGGGLPPHSTSPLANTFLFERRGGSWHLVKPLFPIDPGTGPDATFGQSIALTEELALVGAPSTLVPATAVRSEGAVYLYDLTAPRCSEGFCYGSQTTCPCGNARYPGRGCQGARLTLAGGGTTYGVALSAESLVSDGAGGGTADLRSWGYDSAGRPTVLLLRSLSHGAPIPFGDGLLCIDASVAVPVAVRFATGGVAGFALTHTAGPGTFHYQAQYRNTPASFCVGSAAFNLSNGVTLTWP